MLSLEEIGHPACIPLCFNTNEPNPYGQASYFSTRTQSWEPVYQQIRQVSQFDRPFLSPLPMPSPKSCWYPQRKDVQFGYSYTRPEPYPPDGPQLYIAAQLPYQSFQPPSPPYQLPYNGVDHIEPLGMPRDPVTQDLEPNLSMAALVSQLKHLTADVEQLVSRMDNGKDGEEESLKTHSEHSSLVGLNDATDEFFEVSEPVDYDQSKTGWQSNYDLEMHSRDARPPKLSSAAPAVPPPPPQRSSSCWSSTSPTSHCRSATLLPAAAAAPSLNLPPPAPPCSPDTSPTLVPSSMKMQISEECDNNEKFYNHNHDG